MDGPSMDPSGRYRGDCKTSIHRFESGRRLHTLSTNRPAARPSGSPFGRQFGRESAPISAADDTGRQPLDEAALEHQEQQ